VVDSQTVSFMQCSPEGESAGGHKVRASLAGVLRGEQEVEGSLLLACAVHDVAARRTGACDVGDESGSTAMEVPP
jgi:hypothetical protein